MIDALLAVEDRRFFSHHGMDPIRIAGAAWRNFRAGRIVEGGSTITQQLARASLSSERTYDRKIREILLAAQIEQRYTKAQILEQYLNTVYLGDGYYGVEAASRRLLRQGGRRISSRTKPRCWRRSCDRRRATHRRSAPARALKRRNLVLRLMRDEGRLSAEALRTRERHAAPGSAKPDERQARPRHVAASGSDSGLYFQEEVRRQLFALFGADKVLRGGLRVHSTYDPEMQRQAEAAVTARIAEIAKTRPAARDLQGSLVAIDPHTGDVRALVGGRDFKAAASIARRRRAARQAPRSSQSSTRRRSSAATHQGRCCATSTRQLTAGDAIWLPVGRTRAVRVHASWLRSKCRAIVPPLNCFSKSA